MGRGRGCERPGGRVQKCAAVTAAQRSSSASVRAPSWSTSTRTGQWWRSARCAAEHHSRHLVERRRFWLFVSTLINPSRSTAAATKEERAVRREAAAAAAAAGRRGRQRQAQDQGLKDCSSSNMSAATAAAGLAPPLLRGPAASANFLRLMARRGAPFDFPAEPRRTRTGRPRPGLSLLPPLLAKQRRVDVDRRGRRSHGLAARRGSPKAVHAATSRTAAEPPGSTWAWSSPPGRRGRDEGLRGGGAGVPSARPTLWPASHCGRCGGRVAVLRADTAECGRGRSRTGT